MATDAEKVNRRVMPTVSKLETGLGVACVGAAALAMSPVLLAAGAFFLLCGKAERR